MYQSTTGSPTSICLPPSSTCSVTRPPEVHDRAGVAEHLLGRAVHERQVVAQLGELVGVLEERVHAVGREVAGGLVARDREQQEEQVDLELGEHVALDLGLGQRR